MSLPLLISCLGSEPESHELLTPRGQKGRVEQRRRDARSSSSIEPKHSGDSCSTFHSCFAQPSSPHCGSEIAAIVLQFRFGPLSPVQRQTKTFRKRINTRALESSRVDDAIPLPLLHCYHATVVCVFSRLCLIGP